MLSSLNHSERLSLSIRLARFWPYRESAARDPGLVASAPCPSASEQFALAFVKRSHRRAGVANACTLVPDSRTGECCVGVEPDRGAEVRALSRRW